MTGLKLLRIEPILHRSTFSKAAAGTAARGATGADAGTVERMFLEISAGAAKGTSGGAAEETAGRTVEGGAAGRAAATSKGTAAEGLTGWVICSVATDGSLFAGVGAETAG